jgi:hypothetical protein
MDQVLLGIPGVHCIIDMVITGSTPEEHLNNLEKVMPSLDTFNLRANTMKCDIFKDSGILWAQKRQTCMIIFTNC